MKNLLAVSFIGEYFFFWGGGRFLLLLNSRGGNLTTYVWLYYQTAQNPDTGETK